MQKAFSFGKGEFLISFGQGVVRIESNEELLDYIGENPAIHTRKLVETIQEIYIRNYGRKLKVTDNSLIIEIWGHTYFEYFMLRNERLGRILFPFGLYRRLVASCEAIDCGEAGIDGNRWLWDVLSVFVPLISRFIPRKSLS